MDELFHFDVPAELIAQAPASPRDHARLLVYDRRTKTLTDDYFYNLANYLPKNTRVVANNTRVDHCRYLFDSGKVEIFAVESVNDCTVRAMVRPGRKFRRGALLQLDGVEARVTNVDADGIRTIVFDRPLDAAELVRASHVPLPPYIAQNDRLAPEYQTIYAKQSGSLAAPTAGLHFTPELRQRIAEQFGWEEVTLSVGRGTFAPLVEENFKTGSLHFEQYSLSSRAFDLIAAAEHVTAVGTTSLRALESVFSTHTTPSASDTTGSVPTRTKGLISGRTSLFIRPGYDFRRVDSLITNFHLPGTSLLLLTEAFVGSRAELEAIYNHALSELYRFYSFGDAMLIV